MGNTRSTWDGRDDEIEGEGEGGGDNTAENGQSVPVGAYTSDSRQTQHTKRG